MEGRRLWLAAALAASLFATVTRAQTVTHAQKETLLKVDHAWNGSAYKHYPAGRPELTVLKLTIPAHAALPWHTHPFPNAAYVLSGELTVRDRKSGQSRTFHQGEAFAETVNSVHRGVTGDQPAVLIVTYAGTPGIKTSQAIVDEQPEY